MRHIISSVEVTHGVNLVLHQCDQRRNNHRRTIHHHGGKLIAERLTATGGHQHKGVIAFKNTFDNLFLVALEHVKPEIFFQIVVYGSISMHMIFPLPPFS